MCPAAVEPAVGGPQFGATFRPSGDQRRISRGWPWERCESAIPFALRARRSGHCNGLPSDRRWSPDPTTASSSGELGSRSWPWRPLRLPSCDRRLGLRWPTRLGNESIADRRTERAMGAKRWRAETMTWQVPQLEVLQRGWLDTKILSERCRVVFILLGRCCGRPKRPVKADH